MTLIEYPMLSIGTRTILSEDEDFVHGYTNGYETHHTYHQHNDLLDTSTLLFLLRNGWDAGHSDEWNTGYIMGWLAGFYEQEAGQLALSMNVPKLVNTQTPFNVRSK